MAGGEDSSFVTGKTWTWYTFLRDHTRFLSILPSYLSAYIVPGRALKPTDIEAVMLTMNSYNTCPYCTGLHGELARMAGCSPQLAAENQKEKKDNTPPPPSSSSSSSSSSFVVYARAFALSSGRGSSVSSAYEDLIADAGKGKAKSVNALCWALLWGKTTGNSINEARDNLLSFSSFPPPLDLLLLLYYGPLFFIIGCLNMVLKFLPPISSWMSTAIGAFLWVPQAIFILPLGIISVLCMGGRVV